MMISCKNKTDFELTDLLKKGNALAFTQLYKKYSGKMYANMYKMVKDEQVVEEMIQVLFSRIWQQRAIISYETDFSAYLYRAASNLVCDFYRKLESDKKMRTHFKLTITEEYSHIEEAIYYQESKDLLEQAMARLSPQQRHVYQLCKLDGCSYKETAAQLGISPYTVKEYLCKAKQLVKTFMTTKLEKVAVIIVSVLYFYCTKQ